MFLIFLPLKPYVLIYSVLKRVVYGWVRLGQNFLNKFDILFNLTSRVKYEIVLYSGNYKSLRNILFSLNMEKNPSRNPKMFVTIKSPLIFNPVGKIAEKAMWRSVFLCIWHCIFNADLTKTPSSSVTF